MPKRTSSTRRVGKGPRGLYLFSALIAVSVLGASQVVQAQTAPDSGTIDLPDGPQPQIDDPISDAELQDLKTIASQSGMSLQSAIDRYAWNDNFALALASVREVSPQAFAGAAIVDADTAWVAFKEATPQAAREIIATFERSHVGVSVGVRTDVGFTELELEKAIPTVHYAILGRPEVREATTSFDFTTGQIRTTVGLKDTVTDTVPSDLRTIAEQSLIDATRTSILDKIGISVIRSRRAVLGGSDSSSEHLGGEAFSTCTSGFGTINSNGTKGTSTAGHCGNSQSDDGVSLTFKNDYEGTHGDFQWHTGTQPNPDDFYAGSTSSTEVNLRDVVSIGSPAEGQSLCMNGKTTNAHCQEVRQLGVCHNGSCNLVQMGERQADGGDSGGPYYWGNTAYGLHKGWHYDPFAPFDRDLFSRADRIDDALGISINS